MAFKKWQVACCCSSGCGCFVSCNNINIPSNSLTLTLIGSGHRSDNPNVYFPYSVSETLEYYSNSNFWMTDCLTNDVFSQFSCILGDPPPGIGKFVFGCSSICNNPFKLYLNYLQYCTNGLGNSPCPPSPNYNGFILEHSYCANNSLSIANPLNIIFNGQSNNPTISLAGYDNGDGTTSSFIFFDFVVTGQSIYTKDDLCAIFCVTDCGKPVPSSIVIVENLSSIVSSGTTGKNGCVTLNIHHSGNYNVVIQPPSLDTRTFNRNLNCQTYTFDITPSGTVCCGEYAIPKNLTLTDDAGDLSFVYYPNSFYPTWYGGHAVNRLSSSVTTPNNICVAAIPDMGPVRVCYQMICFAGDNPTFSLQRTWSWVYQPDTLDPIYYQDDSGFIPGQPCTTGPPAMCGSPHTDVATDDENPSTNVPFKIEFNPVSAPSNYTGDPIGGSVTIS